MTAAKKKSELAVAMNYLEKTFGADAARDARIEFELARIAGQALRVARLSGLSRRQIAKQMGNSSPSVVQRLVSEGAHNATVETLFRFAVACDHQLSVTFVPAEAVTWETGVSVTPTDDDDRSITIHGSIPLCRGADWETPGRTPAPHSETFAA